MLLLLCVLLSAGCSTFIVRDDDNLAQASGKIGARTLTAVATLGLSELYMGGVKINESIQAQSEACLNRGMVPVTNGMRGIHARYVGCFTQDGFERYMASQASHPMLMIVPETTNRKSPVRGLVPLSPPPVAPRQLNCTSTAIGNTTNTNCY